MVGGFIVFYLYFGWMRSLFSVLHFNWMRHLFSRVMTIFISASVLGAAILYLFPESRNSRYLYLSFAAFSFAFIGAEKLLLKEIIARARRYNRNTTPVIIVGRGGDATEVIREITEHPEWGLRIARILDIAITPAEFEDVLKTSHIEEVFFCVPRNLTITGMSIDPYLRICEEMGRPARVFLNIPGATSFAQWEFRTFMERPTLISQTVELDPDQVLLKRLFDIVGALAGLVVLFICYPWLALSIKCTSKGPVFFTQVRVGKNGKRFIMYKFRSMYVDAEQRKQGLAKLNECNGAMFKMKDDPRVTKIGRFMRRLSLDELPQFINVLKGEMSLVGTRPPTPDEVSMYQKWHHRRISIRPGITGLWQVSGRNMINDFDEIVKLDLTYIDHWSIWLDVRIILKTLVLFFKRDYAY